MEFISFRSISRRLTLLIILAVFPSLAILFYSGIEQRRQSIEKAKRDVLLMTQSMAESQKEITRSTRQILSTLSLLPVIRNMDIRATNKILEAVLKQNPNYNNIALVDLDGNVLAAGKKFSETNLADRKHVREALQGRKFAVGEYIVSRVGTSVPSFAFAYPVIDNDDTFKAILVTSVSLTSIANFFDISSFPKNSFVAVTDHKGIRIYYYPPQTKTNPIGIPILGENWQVASTAKKSGIFSGRGSDGLDRILAFEQVRLSADDTPYLYVWAGIPEDQIMEPANLILARNLVLMFLATMVSLCVSWVVGRNTLISPLQNLVTLTRKFAQGNLESRIECMPKISELELLTKAFHEMADELCQSQRTLQESEFRFRLLMDSLDAFIYVADIETYDVLFVNEYAKKQIGDVTGQKCWKSIQNMTGPCSFCTNKYLLNEEGRPGEPFISELQNTNTGKWFYMQDRAIEWIDGRIVRLQIATDFTDRKRNEDEREQLIAQLKEASAQIKILSGFLPICASCKMIRDDKGYWNEIEIYIRDHSEAQFSHGICPDCAKKLYPEIYCQTK